MLRLPGSLPVLIGAALVVLILAALAGWYLMKKRKPQRK
jgi:lipopolysaccharide export LptBFGC system permease protein LptF